jgi:hypothetical protein
MAVLLVGHLSMLTGIRSLPATFDFWFNIVTP